MMNHKDAEITDVMVVLDCGDAAKVQAVVAQLCALGLAVDNLDTENNVVEGSIASDRLDGLKHVECVRYVRPIFSYTADFPPGDPRDKDGADELDADDED